MPALIVDAEVQALCLLLAEANVKCMTQFKIPPFLGEG